VAGVTAEHDAARWAPASRRHLGYGDGVMVPVEAFDLPDGLLHAVVLQVLHDAQGLPGPELAIVTARVPLGRALFGVGGRHQQFEDEGRSLATAHGVARRARRSPADELA